VIPPHNPDLDDAIAPPEMLSHPLDAGPPLDPIRSDPALAAVHDEWRRVASAGAARPDASGGERRGRTGATTDAVVREIIPLIDDDRAMIGTLIRAVDRLAGRCDELADRLAALEATLEELGNVTGEEVARLRAAVAGRPAGPGGTMPRPPGRPGPDDA
jgi:hypothetical protein